MEKQLLKIWEKGNYKRGYLSEKTLCLALDLKIQRYKTGNVKHAELKGDEISNCECNRILAASSNAYYDYVNEEWSFDVDTQYGKLIDKYFKDKKEI